MRKYSGRACPRTLSSPINRGPFRRRYTRFLPTGYMAWQNWGSAFRITPLPLRVESRHRPPDCVATTSNSADRPLPNWFAPLFPAIFTVSLAPNSSLKMRFASGFSMLAWIARLSGRAPYTGSKPAFVISASALRVRPATSKIARTRAPAPSGEESGRSD